MKSSIRSSQSYIRNSQPGSFVNDIRNPLSTTNQTSTSRIRNQPWLESSSNFSLEDNNVHGIRSPSNLNPPNESTQGHKARHKRPVTFNDTQESISISSPTNVRFRTGSGNYSPRGKEGRNVTYDLEPKENKEHEFTSRHANPKDVRPEAESKDYLQMETEIVGLKNEIMGRLQNQKYGKRSNQRVENNESSSSSSSPENTTRKVAKGNPMARVAEKNGTREGVKKKRDDSKIKIYDEADTLVAEPEGKDRDKTDRRAAKEEGRIAEKNLEEMSEALKKKERASERKYSELKTKFKELKGILKGYVNRVIDLEDVLKKKEDLLNNCETQIRSDHKKLMKSNDLIEELKNREQALQRSEGSAVGSSAEYKTRYLEQKDEVKKLKGLLDEIEGNSRIQIQGLNRENEQIRLELEAGRLRELSLKEKLDGKYQGIDNLERDLKGKENLLGRYEAERAEREGQIRLIRDELEKARIEREKMERRLDESNKVRLELEANFGQYQRKAEEDIQGLLLERDNDLNVKKDKIKKLKDQAKEQEKLASKATEEKKFLEVELEKLLGQKNQIEREMYRTKDDLKVANKEIIALKSTFDSMKNQFNETYDSLRSETSRTDQMQNEIKKLNKLLKVTESKLAVRDSEVEKAEESNVQLRTEVKTLLEENTKFKEYNAKLEDRLGFLQAHQTDEISKVESKLEEFYREIFLLKEENKALKTAEVSLNREVATLREERERFRSDYKEMKQANKILEKELIDLNRNMTEIINEKTGEIKRQQRPIASQLEREVKREVFGEVQDMIKNHRQSIRRFE